MIYFMSTKTLTKEFYNTFSPDIILESKYVLFSAKMIPSEKYEKIAYRQNVFFALENDEYKNINIIREELTSSARDLGVLCKCIEESIVFPDNIIVILSTPKEIKSKYPYYLAKTIESMFEYPIIDFKHGRYKKYNYNPKNTCRRLKYYKALVNKRVFEDYPERVKEITKKSRKETLKVLGGYQKGMTQEEIDRELVYTEHFPFKH